MIKLKRIHFINYLVHQDNTFEFQMDFNEIIGPNEFGKSTLLRGIVDAFSLVPKNLLGKNTKGIDKSPVIELDFDINDQVYTMVINSQEESLTLRGNDGTYLTSKESIKRFFDTKGLPFFSFVVKRLLYLNERDLFVDADSSEFKKFTQDILNVDKINKLIGIIDRIIGKRLQFKKGKLGDLYINYIKIYEDTLKEIENIENELNVYFKRINRFNELDKMLENIKRKISLLSRKTETIAILAQCKEMDQYKKRHMEIQKNINDLKNIQLTLQNNLEKLTNKKTLHEKRDKYLKELKNKIIEYKNDLKEQKDFNEELINKKKEFDSIRQKRNLLTNDYETTRSVIERLENDRKLLKDKLDDIKLKQKEVQFVIKEINLLNKRIQDANILKESIERLENEISEYKGYEIKTLKNILTQWSAMEALKQRSVGEFEVIDGRIIANGKEILSGDKISFAGSLILQHDKFLAKVYAHHDISNLEDKLKEYIDKFKNKEHLEQVIEKLSKLIQLKDSFEKLEFDKIIAQKDEYLNKKKRLEDDIANGNLLYKDLIKLNEELSKQKKLFEKTKDELFKVSNRFAEIQGKIKSIERELENIDLNSTRSQIEDLLQYLDMDIKVEEIDLDIVDNLIEQNFSILKQINNDYNNLIEKRAQYKERIKNLDTELNSLDKELEKSSLIYSKLDELTFGEVKEFQDYSLDELNELQRDYSERLNKLTKEYETMSREYFELKGLVAHIPDKKLLEEKRHKIVEIGKKIDRLEKIRRLLCDSKLVLEELRENLEKTYLKNLQKRTSEIFKEITENRYRLSSFNSSTLFRSKEDFARSWVVEDFSGRSFLFDELSDGTKSQLLLSIRLALISSFLGNHKAFLLLDEPFAYFDDTRKILAKNILTRLCELGWQIILVSARK